MAAHLFVGQGLRPNGAHAWIGGWTVYCYAAMKMKNVWRILFELTLPYSFYHQPKVIPNIDTKIWPGTSGKHARRIFPFELKCRSTNTTEGTSGLFFGWLNHCNGVLWCRCTWGDTCQQQAGRLRWTFSPCLAASKTIGLTRTRTAL